eukprot:g58891.t1
MLRRENELRLGQDFQQRCAMVEHRPDEVKRRKGEENDGMEAVGVKRRGKSGREQPRQAEGRLSCDLKQEVQGASRDWLQEADKLQQRVVVEFGFGGSAEAIQRGLEFLRGAQTLCPNDGEVLSIPLYIRHNRARRHGLVLGQTPIPPISVHRLRIPTRATTRAMTRAQAEEATTATATSLFLATLPAWPCKDACWSPCQAPSADLRCANHAQLCALARHTRRLSLPVDWVYVQIAEAHADDEWPIGNRYNPSVPTRDQTTTLSARAEAACEMAQGFELVGAGFQICVDNPTSDQDQAMGDFERVLAPWPTS